MANFTKRPSQNGWQPTKGVGVMAYSKDRYSEHMCKGKDCARVNTLSHTEVEYCEKNDIDYLCYNCQKKGSK